MESQAKGRARRAIGKWALRVWLVALFLISVSRFAAEAGRLIDMIATVSYFAAVPAMLTAVGFVLARSWRWSLVAGLTAVLAAWPVLGMCRLRASPTPASGGSGDAIVRILTANIGSRSEAIDGLAEMAARHRADVVVIVEISPQIVRLVAGHPFWSVEYPYNVSAQRNVEWPILILSRMPMNEVRFDEGKIDDRYRHLFAYRRSQIIELPQGDGRFLLAGVHLPSPRTSSTWRQGLDSARLLAEVAQKHLLPTEVPVILVGDFNTTPSGSRSRLIARESGLHPLDLCGGGPIGSWPSDWPGLLRLPIDSAWGSEGVTGLSRRVLEDVGSDHRPVLFTMAIKRR